VGSIVRSEPLEAAFAAHSGHLPLMSAWMPIAASQQLTLLVVRSVMLDLCHFDSGHFSSFPPAGCTHLMIVASTEVIKGKVITKHQHWQQGRISFDTSSLIFTLQMASSLFL
jgi:hypothetical protein